MPGRNYAGFALEAVLMEPTWPSTSPALVTELWPLLSLEPAQGINKEFTNDGHGPVGYTAADVVRIAPSFPVSLALTYGGLEPVFTAALGLELKRSGATVLPEQLAPGVYRHLFTVDPVLSAMAPWSVPGDGVESGDITTGQRKVRRGTVAAFREFGCWEWLSCMINQLSLSWTAQQGYGTCGLECLAYSTNLSPTVNTPTTLRKAKPNASPLVLFKHGKVRLAPYSTVTPLNDGDKLVLESLNVTLQNQLAVDFGPKTQNHPEEYERSGPPIVLGSLLKSRYADNSRVTAWEANTTYMLDAKFTWLPIPGTSYRYQLNLYVPGFKFTQVEPSAMSAGRSSEPMQWFATTPDVMPAGFPVTARMSPFIIETIGTRATHMLL